MKFTITYCIQWNFLPQASRAEEEIKSVDSDAEVLRIPSIGGVFTVEVDGKLIYSKKEDVGTSENRFPEAGELLRLLKTT